MRKKFDKVNKLPEKSGSNSFLKKETQTNAGETWLAGLKTKGSAGESWFRGMKK